MVSFNNNGIWIKENLENKDRIITAPKLIIMNLNNVLIFHFDENFKLKEKIYSKNANIKNNDWIFK